MFRPTSDELSHFARLRDHLTPDQSPWEELRLWADGAIGLFAILVPCLALLLGGE